MGLYDCRCMISGVSLKGAGTVLVPLQATGGIFSPIALGVTGIYNRLGSIDMIEEDASTAMLLEFFLGKLATGEFVVDENYLRNHEFYPIERVEQLLGGFERNINDHPRAALLDGRPVLFSLISKSIWQALVRVATPRAITHEALFPIYGNRSELLQEQIRELAAIVDYLNSRGLAWQRADNPEQHYSDDMLAFLDEARLKFSDCEAVLEGLRTYEREVQEELR